MHKSSCKEDCNQDVCSKGSKAKIPSDKASECSNPYSSPKKLPPPAKRTIKSNQKEEDRKRNSSNQSQDQYFWEKIIPNMVNKHGNKSENF